jgi:hypothetical protein
MDGRLSKRVPGWQRAVALAGVVAFLAFSLGCLSIGGRTEIVQPADPQVAKGTLTIPAHQSLDVFYPNPYVATPNLIVENTWNDCKIEEQQANHFRIHNPGPFAREITWKARGEKMPAEVLLQSAKAGLGMPSATTPSATSTGAATVAGVER